MNDYIKEYKNSLSPEFCKYVIDVFENETDKYEGKTFVECNPFIKKKLKYFL